MGVARRHCKGLCFRQYLVYPVHSAGFKEGVPGLMRRRKIIGVIAAALMAVLLVSSGSVLPTPHHEAGQDRLVVMTYNTGGGPEKKAEGDRTLAIVEAVRRAAPDLLFLQECREKDWDSLVDALDMGFGRFVPYQGKEKKSGLAILSRYPLVEPRAHYFPASPNGMGFLMCDVDVQGTILQVANIHLDRIQRIQTKKAMPKITWRTALSVVKDELLAETTRARQVDLLLERMHAGAYPVILAGDFNTIPYATAIRKVQQRFQDALWPSSDFFSNTYKDLGFPFKPRIDYIFHSHGITMAESGIIRSGSGDHFPVWAELILPVENG